MRQEKMWDYYQSEGVSCFDGGYLRLHFLASKCKKNSKVLNIGVGGGIFEKIALQKGLDVYSLDPSEGPIRELQGRIGVEKAKIGVSNDIPFDSNFFDVIIMSEVLEHLTAEVMEETLAEVYRTLRRGGRFMGTVPADEVLSESIVICPNCSCQFHRWGHVQHFDRYILEDLLSKRFLNVRVLKKGWLSREKLNIKTWIYSKLNDMLYRLDMRRYHGNLFFCCEK